MSNQNIIDVTPFEPLILKLNYNFNWKELEPVCEDLIKNAHQKVPIEYGNGASSVSNKKYAHMCKEFNPFYNWLRPYATHIIKNEWNLQSQIEYKVSNSWVNYHLNGGITKEHIHEGTVMVVAAYLNVPDDSGFIEFRHPLEIQKSFHFQEEQYGIWNWKTIPIKTGDVLMFPGWLMHRTQPSKSNEKRWVLTTNID